MKRVVVNKRWREIDQDKKLSERLMQSIPKRFLAFIYSEGRQTLKRIIQIIPYFLEKSVVFFVIYINSIHLHFCVQSFNDIWTKKE